MDINDPRFGRAMAERLHRFVSTKGMNRLDVLDRFRVQLAAGNLLVGAGAGTGLSAKCVEAGGADLIVIYNSGRFRMAGRGSLAGMMPYGDANAIVVEMAAKSCPSSSARRFWRACAGRTRSD